MPQSLSSREQLQLATPGNNRRVLLVLTGLASDGGAEVQTVQLAVRLKRRGWNVSLVSLLPVEEVPAAVSEAGIPVESAGMRGGSDALKGLLRLSEIFERRQPHIVHSHMTHAILAARMARMRKDVPVLIGTLHGLHMYNLSGGGHRMRELLHRATDRWSDLTTVVCGAAFDYYRNTKAAPERKLRLVVNGVDCDHFRPDPELRARKRAELHLTGEFTWLTVARFDAVKDHRTLLRAFAVVVREHPRSVLLLAGDGNLKTPMMTEAFQLGISGNVRFLGLYRDVNALCNAADACVLTSRFEALPLTLLEAGASGLPAVATNVGGCASVVADGETGFLAPAGDVDAVAQAMLRLQRLPEIDRLCLGTAARERAMRLYGFDSVVEQWESLYLSLLAAKGVTA